MAASDEGRAETVEEAMTGRRPAPPSPSGRGELREEIAKAVFNARYAAVRPTGPRWWDSWQQPYYEMADAVLAVLRERGGQEDYPHKDGDFIVLGPEVFASADGEVISWRGENYVKQERGGQEDVPADIKRNTYTADREPGLHAKGLGLERGGQPPAEPSGHETHVDVETRYHAGGRGDEYSWAVAYCDGCDWTSEGDEGDVRDAAWTHEEPVDRPSSNERLTAKHAEALLRVIDGLPVCGDPEHRHSGSCEFWDHRKDIREEAVAWLRSLARSGEGGAE